MYEVSTDLGSNRVEEILWWARGVWRNAVMIFCHKAEDLAARVVADILLPESLESVCSRLFVYTDATQANGGWPIRSFRCAVRIIPWGYWLRFSAVSRVVSPRNGGTIGGCCTVGTVPVPVMRPSRVLVDSSRLFGSSWCAPLQPPFHDPLCVQGHSHWESLTYEADAACRNQDRLPTSISTSFSTLSSFPFLPFRKEFAMSLCQPKRPVIQWPLPFFSPGRIMPSLRMLVPAGWISGWGVKDWRVVCSYNQMRLELARGGAHSGSYTNLIAIGHCDDVAIRGSDPPLEDILCSADTRMIPFGHSLPSGLSTDSGCCLAPLQAWRENLWSWVMTRSDSGGAGLIRGPWFPQKSESARISRLLYSCWRRIIISGPAWVSR